MLSFRGECSQKRLPQTLTPPKERWRSVLLTFQGGHVLELPEIIIEKIRPCVRIFHP